MAWIDEKLKDPDFCRRYISDLEQALEQIREIIGAQNGEETIPLLREKMAEKSK